MLAWVYRAAQGMLPGACVLCAGPGDGGASLCAGCRRQLLERRGLACELCAAPLAEAAATSRCARCTGPVEAYRRVHAALDYDGAAAWLVRRFKFHGELASGRALAELMVAALPVSRGWTPPEVVVPVPLHPVRLRVRGFDQARELAREFAGALSLPLADALRRRRATAPQSTATDVAERRRNLRHAFTAAAGADVEGARVLLVDDVVTTGSTVAEAARALGEAGVADVVVGCCAQTPPAT